MIYLLTQILKFLIMWVVIPYIVLLFSKDISSYVIWRLKYKRQGIQFQYYPLEGQRVFTFSEDKANGMKRFTGLFTEFEK